MENQQKFRKNITDPQHGIELLQENEYVLPSEVLAAACTKWNFLPIDNTLYEVIGYDIMRQIVHLYRSKNNIWRVIGSGECPGGLFASY